MEDSIIATLNSTEERCVNKFSCSSISGGGGGGVEHHESNKKYYTVFGLIIVLDSLNVGSCVCDKRCCSLGGILITSKDVQGIELKDSGLGADRNIFKTGPCCCRTTAAFFMLFCLRKKAYSVATQ